MKIILETNDPAPDMSAKMLVQFARKKVRQDRKQCYDMISLIKAAWSIPRPIAAAVLFSEVRLRTCDDKGSQEFNWPEDTVLDE
jgi:hypothetical protein